MRRSRKKAETITGFADQSGLALFEVLISAAILSVGCVLLLRALAQSVRTAAAAEDQFAAALALENRLWELEHAGAHAALDDSVPENLTGATWQLEEKSLTTAGLQDALTQRTLTLAWCNSSLSLSSYRVRNEAE